jgi:hypothetical protein
MIFHVVFLHHCITILFLTIDSISNINSYRAMYRCVLMCFGEYLIHPYVELSFKSWAFPRSGPVHGTVAASSPPGTGRHPGPQIHHKSWVVFRQKMGDLHIALH